MFSYRMCSLIECVLFDTHESRDSEGYGPKSEEMKRARERRNDALGLDAPSLSQVMMW